MTKKEFERFFKESILPSVKAMEGKHANDYYAQEYFVDAIQAVRALLNCDFGPTDNGILDSTLCDLLVEAGETP